VLSLALRFELATGEAGPAQPLAADAMTAAATTTTTTTTTTKTTTLPMPTKAKAPR
jgi:hypothetical protein